MPTALKLKEEYGDSLQIIFVESQSSGFDKSVGDALKYGWLIHDVIWTSDYIFSTGSRSLPSFALLDSNGSVVVMGNSISLKGKMEDAIARLVQESGAGPAGIPASVSKVYAQLSKGNYAKAMVAAEKLQVKPGSKETELVLRASKAAITGILAKLEAQLARTDWLLQNGYPIRAQEIVKGLAKGVKGNETMSAKVEPYIAKFEGDEVKAQLSAAKKLAKLESALYEDGKNGKSAAKLSEFAEKHSANPLGTRALGLAKLAGSS